ncbi:hypothetical protein FRC17_005780 [Serendipita sp. 399]|nr:hypothetical protein FRC17_005780 [Serendipita sp. 399]
MSPSKRSFRFSKEAIKVFDDYFKTSPLPPSSQINEWAEQFKVDPKSVRNWFQSRRAKLSKREGPVVRQFPPLDREALQLEEEEAKIEFSYVKEEIIIRLVKVLNDHPLTQSILPQVAKQIGVSESVVMEFVRWREKRRPLVQSPNAIDAAMDYQNHPTTELSSPSAVGSSPTSPFFTTMDLAEEEVKAAAASLPTPQASLSPRSVAADPEEVTVPAFYVVWQTARQQKPYLQKDDRIPQSTTKAFLCMIFAQKL